MSQAGLSCVYFALLVGHGIVKIGCSRKPGSRARGIRLMCRRDFGFDPEVEYLALVRGNETLERRYHKRFVQYVITKEWFRACPEILDYALGLPSMAVCDFYKGNRCVNQAGARA